MLNTQPAIVAIDDGFDSTKAVTSHRQICVPTSVTRASRLTTRVMTKMGGTRHPCYEIEGALYAVGPEVINPINTRFDEFPYSGANLAVAMDALRQVLPGGATAHVVTGVPFNRFYGATGEQRKTDLARKVSAWRRFVRETTGLHLPRIVAINVVAEAVAAWFDYVIGPDLEMNTERYSECTAVVDIGGRTTDVAVVQDGEIDMRQSGTLDVGMLELAAVVRRLVDEQLPGIPGRPHTLVDSAIHRGVIRIGDREIEVRDAVEREKSELIDRIVDYLAALYGQSMGDIRRILFVGGGSALLENSLRKRFPKAVFAEDPQMANARGMWKFQSYSAAEEQGSTPALLSQETEEAWVAPVRATLTR